MRCPAVYPPDPTLGVTDPQMLPPPKLVSRSRNYVHRPCPVCGGAVASASRIMRLFRASSSRFHSDPPPQEASSIASTTDTPATTPRSDRSLEGPRSAVLPPRSTPSPNASAVG